MLSPKFSISEWYTMIWTAFSNWAVIGRLKRILVLLAFITSGAALLLYWRQQSEEGGFRNEKRLNVVVAGAPQWTWVCRQDRCERKLDRGIKPLQSLATCSMLCGSPKLWPLPTGPLRLSSVYVPVKSELFTLDIVKYPGKRVRKHVKDAFELMKLDLRTYEMGAPGPPLPSGVKKVLVRVFVNGTDDPRLTLKTDESYELYAKPIDGNLVIDIFSKSFCGARHAFETLSQLVWLDPYAGGGGLVMLEAAAIKDAPKFHYRGLLLDTARNYFPVDDIIRTLDAMGAAKLNTFHWHITDSQSFPLKLKSVPKLFETGAYGPGAVYTTDDVRMIVRRARLRGIRVIMEVDAPAHVGKAWAFGPEAGLGELALCIEQEPWLRYCGEPPCGQLNPKNENVYDILEKIYREIIDLTGVTDVFHLGGDEVSDECWRQHFNDSDPMDLWTSFTFKALDRLKRANNGVLPDLNLLWSSKMTVSPYLTDFDNKRIGIQTWGSSTWPESVAPIDGGFRTIVSHVDAWYLDCGYGSWRDSGAGHCGPVRSWQQVWGHRPWMNDNGLIIGGSVCMWTEQLDTNELDGRVWPRTAAFSERVWSDPSMMDPPADVYWRLDYWRRRAVIRGLRAAPLWPRWCEDNPMACL